MAPRTCAPQTPARTGHPQRRNATSSARFACRRGLRCRMAPGRLSPSARPIPCDSRYGTAIRMRLLEMHHLVHQGRQNLARAALLEVPDIERDLVVNLLTVARAESLAAALGRGASHTRAAGGRQNSTVVAAHAAGA